MFAEQLAGAFGTNLEGDIHPHVREEKGHLFQCIDAGSTELEILNLLNALVLAFKPRIILETGSLKGFGTISLASAMKFNGFGHLHSLELSCTNIRDALFNVNLFDSSLANIIEFHNTNSCQWLKNYDGKPIDFAFLDSDLDDRLKELEIITNRKLLSEDAIVIVHDTSPERHKYSSDFQPDLLPYLNDLSRGQQWLSSNLSRGFYLIKFHGVAKS